MDNILPQSTIDWLFQDESNWHSFVDVLAEVRDIVWTKDTAMSVFTQMPFVVQAEALQWSLSDTVFRDAAYSYLRDHPHLVEDIQLMCGLCHRPLGELLVEDHHLTPKELGGKDTVPVHKMCHQKIHATFTNRELLHKYHTFEALRSHPEIQKYIEWVQSKDPSFYDKNDQTAQRRAKNKK